VTNETATDREIVNTDEERDGFNIARAIAVSEVAPDRIFLRDAKAYCAVLLDDNNRKPIIRLNLNLNGKNVKFVITFEHGKDAGIRRDIESMKRPSRYARRSASMRTAARPASLVPWAAGGRGPVE
jgi:predicted type IV restriction endonuclease